MGKIRNSYRGDSTNNRTFCARCVHLWRDRGREKCGSENVSQDSLKDARAIDGDCGPLAAYFKTLTFDEDGQPDFDSE